MDSVQFLDAVRARHSIASDRKLAVFLGIDRTRLPAYRNGRRTLDADTCIKVAAALELPPEHVLASVQAERAKRTEHRRIWERLAELAKRSNAACMFVFVSVFGFAAAAVAAELQGLQSILRQIRRSVIGSTANNIAQPVPCPA